MGLWRPGFASTCHHPSFLYGGRGYKWNISWCNLKCKISPYLEFRFKIKERKQDSPTKKIVCLILQFNVMHMHISFTWVIQCSNNMMNE